MATPRFDALLFDLDGTLVDSAEPIVAGLRLVCSRWQRPEPSEAELRSLIGVPLDASFASLGITAVDIPAARDCYRRFWNEGGGRERTRLMAGAAELLAALDSAGLTLAVVTAKVTAGGYQTVRRFAIADHFGDRVFGHEPADGPGKEGALRRALASLPNHRHLLIGDALPDAEAAARCDTPFLWCRYGYGQAQRLQALPHVASIERLAAIADFCLS